MMETTLGILLQTIPYLGKKKILKVLTPEHGLLSFMTQKPLSPFCIAEWVYRKTQKEIHTLTDFSLTDPLLELRQNYATISAAGSIAQDLLLTQMPGKPSPYALASAYLKKLPLNPPILALSFRLKLLIHEGLFSSDPEPEFTPEEWELVTALAFARQFSQLQTVTAAPFDKVKVLFDKRLGK